MKTRSNDIIPNAPFKYNSSTDTFEIGSNLNVDGVVRLPRILIDPANHDTGVDITFTTDSLYNSQLKFFFLSDGLQYILKATDSDGFIVTDNNLKTIFGNKSLIKDPDHPEDNNIDLFKHFIAITGTNEDYYIEIISSSNLNVDSLTNLATLTKAVDGTIILSCWSPSLGSPVYLIYKNGVWIDDGNRTIDGTVVDIITTI